MTTKCSQLKMLSADGKRYKTDVATTEQLLRIIQSIPYANRNGMTILLSYIDRAFSAITSDRPEFQNIIWDSEKGLFDIVLVWKIDRFSRDRYGSAHYKHLLKKNGVKVVQLNRIFLMGRNRS